MLFFRRTLSLEDYLAQTVRIAEKNGMYRVEVAKPDMASVIPYLELPGAKTIRKEVIRLVMLAHGSEPHPGRGSILYAALMPEPEVLVLDLHSVSSEMPMALPNDSGITYRNPESHVGFRQYADGRGETVARSSGYSITVTQPPVEEGIAKQLNHAKKGSFGKKAEILMGALAEIGNRNLRHPSTD